jgi:hypothetical protein
MPGVRGKEMATMATVERESNATYSSDAMRLLDCFSLGFDEILSSIAETIASERVTAGGVVEVTKQDVEKAAAFIVKAVQDSTLPQSVKSEVDDMLGCMASQSKSAK